MRVCVLKLDTTGYDQFVTCLRSSPLTIPYGNRSYVMTQKKPFCVIAIYFGLPRKNTLVRGVLAET